MKSITHNNYNRSIKVANLSLMLAGGLLMLSGCARDRQAAHCPVESQPSSYVSPQSTYSSSQPVYSAPQSQPVYQAPVQQYSAPVQSAPTYSAPPSAGSGTRNFGGSGGGSGTRNGF